MRNAATRRKAADVSGTHLWLVLMKAHRTLGRLATQSIESLEVCLSDFGVMELLLHKGPQPVNEIGRRIALTSGAITTAVDRLEARGLVMREAHESDRRTRMVRLTARGKEQAGSVFAGQGGHGLSSERALEDRARHAHRAAQEARHFRRGTRTLGGMSHVGT